MAMEARPLPFGDRGRVAWFEDAAPGLLTSRAIRSYLEKYPQRAWPDVVKLTLIQGIVALEQQLPPGAALTPQQLRAVVERAAAAGAVERKLPALQRQLLDLQVALEDVYEDISGAGQNGGRDQQQLMGVPTAAPALLALPAPPPAAALPVAAPTATRRSTRSTSGGGGSGLAGASLPRRGRVPNPVIAPKPSAHWREGQPTGYPHPNERRPLSPLNRSHDNQGATNPIYPAWWGDPVAPAPKPAPEPAPPRPQPRLAYSVPSKENAPRITRDDLVTVEHLLVKGSGYGQQATAAPDAAAPALGPQPQAGGSPGEVQARDAAAVAAAAHAAAQQAAVAEDRIVAGINAATQRQEAAAGTRARSAAAAAAPTKAKAGQQQQATSRSVPPQPRQPAGPTALRRRVAAATSKIGADVAAARRAAAGRAAVRNERISAAVRSAALEGVMGEMPVVRSESPRSGAASIVDGFLSNPWAAWFMPREEGAADEEAWAPPPVGGSSDTGTTAVEEEEEQEGTPAAEDERAAPFAAAAERFAPGALTGRRADAAKAGVEGAVGHEGPQQQGQRPQREAWACDFGHLENVQPPEPARRGAHRSGGDPQDPNRWAKQWVGDFGHLKGFPRFGAATAFAHHTSSGGGSGAGGATHAGAARGLGGLWMSPGELSSFVEAARERGSKAAAAAAAATTAAAAAATAAGDGWWERSAAAVNKSKSPAKAAGGGTFAAAEGGVSSESSGSDDAFAAATAALRLDASTSSSGSSGDRTGTSTSSSDGGLASAVLLSAARAFGAEAAAAQEGNPSALRASSSSEITGGSSVDGLISSLLARIEEQQLRALAAAGLAAPGEAAAAAGGEPGFTRVRTGGANGPATAAAGGAEEVTVDEQQASDGEDDSTGRLGAALSTVAGLLRAALAREGADGDEGVVNSSGVAGFDDAASDSGSAFEDAASSVLTLSEGAASTVGGAASGAPWVGRSAAAAQLSAVP